MSHHYSNHCVLYTDRLGNEIEIDVSICWDRIETKSDWDVGDTRVWRTETSYEFVSAQGWQFPELEYNPEEGICTDEKFAEAIEDALVNEDWNPND